MCGLNVDKALHINTIYLNVFAVNPGVKMQSVPFAGVIQSVQFT